MWNGKVALMKCKVDGCYAKPYARNLCASHYRLWREPMLTAGPGIKKGALRGAPAPSTKKLGRMSDRQTPGVCVCRSPIPGVIALFHANYVDREPRPGDMVECRECARPIAEYLSA